MMVRLVLVAASLSAVAGSASTCPGEVQSLLQLTSFFGLPAKNTPYGAPRDELEQIVREAVGVKQLCRAGEAGRGHFSAVYVVEVPKPPQVMCSKDGDNLKFAVKFSHFEADSSGEAEANNELDALKLARGIGGVVQYFGTRGLANARYTFMQAADLSLHDFIERSARDKSTFKARVSLLVQMLHALTALEEKGIQHSDLKPANILLAGKCESGHDCHLMLIDFGSACWRREDSESHCRGTGTAKWASPEFAALRVHHSHAPDKWSLPKHDVWSAGMIAYQLLVGVDRHKMSHLFHHRSGDQVFAFLSHEPDLIDKFGLRVPEAWLPLLEGMLQPSAEKRWTMKRASEAADRIAQGLGIKMPRKYKVPAALKSLFSHEGGEGRAE